MIPSGRLGLVILAVEELELTARFYEAACGWRREVDVPVYVELAGEGGARLGLYQRDAYARNVGGAPASPAGGIRPTELYVTVADPVAALSRAVEYGGTLRSPVTPRDWGDEVGYCTDPGGNVVAFARRADRP
ncbi:MAG: VOC family protein [Anaeromyxobacter sp.]